MVGYCSAWILARRFFNSFQRGSVAAQVDTATDCQF
jgi:hypothetical protein